MHNATHNLTILNKITTNNGYVLYRKERALNKTHHSKFKETRFGQEKQDTILYNRKKGKIGK